MNILVTGGSGFIGSALVNKLVADGHKVTVLDTVSPQRTDVEFIYATLGEDNWASLTAIRKANPDIVYHIAGFSNIDKVKNDPVGTVEGNVLATVVLLDICQHLRPSPRFIFSSSAFVYSNHGHLYATTKRCAEDLIKNFHTLYNLPYSILRLGTVYGEHSRGQDVVSIFVKRALGGQPLEIYGDGKQWRRFLYIGDAVEALARAINPKSENKTLTIVGPRMVEVNDLARIVQNTVDCTIEHSPNKQREDDMAGEPLSNIAIEKENMGILGWTPNTEIEKGIQKVIEWYRK